MARRAEVSNAIVTAAKKHFVASPLTLTPSPQRGEGRKGEGTRAASPKRGVRRYGNSFPITGRYVRGMKGSGVSVGVTVAVGVGVSVGVTVGVAVGVAVGVTVGVGVGVAVGVSVLVAVGVLVGMGVNVGMGVGASV